MYDFPTQIQSLLLVMVRALVDSPDDATVRLTPGAMPMTFEVRVAPSDIGKAIGKQGRTARAIRDIVWASAQKFRHPAVSIDIGPTS